MPQLTIYERREHAIALLNQLETQLQSFVKENAQEVDFDEALYQYRKGLRAVYSEYTRFKDALDSETKQTVEDELKKLEFATYLGDFVVHKNSLSDVGARIATLEKYFSHIKNMKLHLAHRIDLSQAIVNMENMPDFQSGWRLKTANDNNIHVYDETITPNVHRTVQQEEIQHCQFRQPDEYQEAQPFEILSYRYSISLFYRKEAMVDYAKALQALRHHPILASNQSTLAPLRDNLQKVITHIENIYDRKTQEKTLNTLDISELTIVLEDAYQLLECAKRNDKALLAKACANFQEKAAFWEGHQEIEYQKIGALLIAIGVILCALAIAIFATNPIPIGAVALMGSGAFSSVVGAFTLFDHRQKDLSADADALAQTIEATPSFF